MAARPTISAALLLGTLFLAHAVVSEGQAQPGSNRVCVWNDDTARCTWHLMSPFSQLMALDGHTQQSADTEEAMALAGISDSARLLIRAALRLRWCSSYGSASPEACGSLSTPATNQSGAGAAAAACAWQPQLSAGAAALLSQLLTGPDGNNATGTSISTPSSPPACLPAEIESLLEPYLALTAPADDCREAVTVEACLANPRCIFEDHYDHMDCYPDSLFVAKQLAAPNGGEDVEGPSGGLSSPLVQAAVQMQHLCSPETNVQSGHDERPSPLDRTACAAQGAFTPLDVAELNRLAAAAGIPTVPIPPPPPPAAMTAPTPQQTVPSPGSGDQHTDDDDEDHADHEHTEDEGSDHVDEDLDHSTADETVDDHDHDHEHTGEEEDDHKDGDETTEHQDGAAEPSSASPPPPSAPARASPPAPTYPNVNDAVVVSTTSCQLEGANRCVPTLMGFAAAASRALAAAGVDDAVRAHAAASDAGRALLSAGYDVMRCTFLAMEPSSAATAACARDALAAVSAASQALSETFNPPCSRLSSQACAARPGCVLEAHDDHYDCKRTARYAAEFLLLNSSAAGAGSTSTAAGASSSTWAQAVQAAADACRTAVVSCGQQRAEAVVSRPLLARLAAASTGQSARSTTGPGSNGSSAEMQEEAPPAPGLVGLIEGEGGEDEPHNEERDSKGLRIASVFIVLLAGLAGCAVPIVLRDWLPRQQLLTAALRALCAGLTLCLALVHIASHAVAEMDGLIEGSSEAESEAGHEGHDHRRRLSAALWRTLPLPLLPRLIPGATSRASSSSLTLSIARHPHRLLLQAADDYGGDEGHSDEAGHGAHDHYFPIAMCGVMFGYLLMVAAEHVTHALIERQYRKAGEVGGRSKVAAADGGKGAGADSGAAAVENPLRCATTDGCVGGEDVESQKVATTVALANKHGAEEDTTEGVGLDLSAAGVHLHQKANTTYASAHDHGHAHSHQHACGGSSSTALEAFRLSGMAVLFELGCVFHSFIIGLSLGTTTHYQDAATLTIALSFHQLLEAVALAVVLVEAKIGLWRMLAAAALYSVTCPLGIAVGIAIADSYDSHSTASRAVQGTLNAVSAGLLLYLASALVACDFGASSLTRWRVWQRVLLFGVMCLGAASFAVLAIWA